MCLQKFHLNMEKFIKSCRGSVTAVFAVLSVCIFVAFSGCSGNLETETVEDEVFVTLRLDEVFQEKAYIRLNHDGNQDDFWFYLVTEDLDSDAEELLNDYLEQKLETDGEIVGNVGTNKNITIDGLQAKTEYRVLASRILPSGKMTGNVADITFTTLRDPDVFELHPLWDIRYKERRTSADDPNVEQEVFICTAGDSEDTYVPCLLTRRDFEKSYGNDLRACFEDYLAFRNLEHVKWENVVTEGSSEHIEDRLRHGDYVLFMIGVDVNGELTGYYAKTDCTIAQEAATEAYRKWIGQWTLTGSCGDTKISYQVEISPDENNLYYRMSGWESTSATDYFNTLPEELPVLLYFEKTTGNAYVVSEAFDDLDDPTLADFYDFFLYGCVEIDYGGVMTEVPVDISNLRIARFYFMNDNLARVAPEMFSFDLDGVHYDANFLYFNYSYTSVLYAGLVPVTADSVVPRISTMRLER